MRLDVQLRLRHGVYATKDAAALGLTRGRNGLPGTLVLRGVRSLLPPPFPVEVLRLSALFYAGPGARLTGLTGAAVLGWRTVAPDEPVWVAVPGTCYVPSRAFVIVVRTTVADAGIVRLGFALASPARILADCAAQVLQRKLLALTANAVRRREVSLTDLAQLTIGHPRLPGCRQLREVIGELTGGAESIKEIDTLKAIARLGYPAPQCGVYLFDGGVLVSIADFYWDGVSGFYDGASHAEWDVQTADGGKRRRLERLGLQVVIVTKEVDDAVLRHRLDAAFAAAARRTGPRRWTAKTRAEVMGS